MLDKIDRKLLALLQEDCTLSLQALADAVNLTTTPVPGLSDVTSSFAMEQIKYTTALPVE